MKKTLVALAVLATAGTAFAQNAISLTGAFGVGLQRSSTTAGQRPHMAITDGGLTFAGSEDLGGGVKAGFSLNQDFFRWTNSVDGAAGKDGSNTLGGTTDVFGTLGGGFGTIKAGQWESLSAAWTGGNVAPISLPDDPWSPAGASSAASTLQVSSRDMRVAYTTPSMGGLKATVLLTDRTNNGANAATEPKNEVGASLGLGYAAGGLSAALSLKNLNIKDGNAYQLGGKYDFGGFMLGAGVDLVQQAGGKDDRIGYLVSAAAPIGPVTIGATYTQSDAVGDPKSYGVGAEYALSKRTAMNLSVGGFDADSGAYKDLQKQARFKVIHSF